MLAASGKRPAQSSKGTVELTRLEDFPPPSCGPKVNLNRATLTNVPGSCRRRWSPPGATRPGRLSVASIVTPPSGAAYDGQVWQGALCSVQENKGRRGVETPLPLPSRIGRSFSACGSANDRAGLFVFPATPMGGPSCRRSVQDCLPRAFPFPEEGVSAKPMKFAPTWGASIVREKRRS